MEYSQKVNEMACVVKEMNHGPNSIPEEGKWVQAKEIKDISGLTHEMLAGAHRSRVPASSL